MSKPSLYPIDEGCYLCGAPFTVTHHIYPGYGRRDVSDREGCTIRLCPIHHNMSRAGIHFDRQLDKQIRMDCQKRWEAREGITDLEHNAFRALFHESYL